MNSWPALDRFLQADPRDAGYDQGDGTAPHLRGNRGRR